jgi:haloacetate dehalogenase
MFKDFKTKKIIIGDTKINLQIGGQGKALMLLHGYPQTHICWHKLVPALMENFTVITPDLRGYGDSIGPVPDSENQLYSKRAMANDVASILDDLSIDKAMVVGHDRGGRVGYRFALDYPERIERLAVLDIIPTSEMWERMLASGFISGYHWQYLAQPNGLPEHMIGLDPDRYLKHTLSSWTKTKNSFSRLAMNEYLRCFRNPSVVAACCADYRAGASLDWHNDAVDKKARKKIECPLMTLWGKRDGRENIDNISIWQEWCSQTVVGHAIESGHFLQEENPEDTLAALLSFLR